MSDVKDYFKKNEDQLEKLDRNFRNKKSDRFTSNAKFSRTFFNARKEKIEK